MNIIHRIQNNSSQPLLNGFSPWGLEHNMTCLSSSLTDTPTWYWGSALGLTHRMWFINPPGSPRAVCTPAWPPGPGAPCPLALWPLGWSRQSGRSGSASWPGGGSPAPAHVTADHISVPGGRGGHAGEGRHTVWWRTEHTSERWRGTELTGGLA